MAGSTGASKGYTIHKTSGLDDRPMRVVCVGAGLSGIYFAIQLSMATKNVELVVYEKNSDVGGTWLENVYPGCACDVPSHRYTYTFEPNPSWKSFFASAEDIQHYFARVSRKYGADKYIKLKHKIVAAKWNEASGKWETDVAGPDGQVFRDECDVFVDCSGVLNSWKWPSIPGLDSFKGTLLHSASYDRSVDLTGKTVAVIGSGSSGIQIVPAIQPQVKHLGAYLRSATYILPPFGSEFLKKDDDGKFILDYTPEEIRNFEEDPDSLLEYRRLLERDISRAFRMFITNDPVQSASRTMVEAYMRDLLKGKPELAEKLIPDWPVGCRRITPGIGFLESLCEDNVSPIFADIASIDEEGIVTTDSQRKTYDVIICATGFDVSHGARFPFEGRNGHVLDEAYRENPTSYFALTKAGFPNYFCFNGPNAPVGAGSLVPACEAQGDYIVKAIVKLQRENIKSMMVKQQAVAEFVQHVDTWMPDSVWASGCRSWYKNGKINGRVTALWPGSGLHFIRALENPRWEDYEYTYHDLSNRYAYLADGFTPLENAGGDRTFDLEIRTKRMQGHPALQRTAQ